MVSLSKSSSGGKSGSKTPTAATPTSGAKQSSAGASTSTGHKEDYESDVEDVPDDLAMEMAPNLSKKKKSKGNKYRPKHDGTNQDEDEGSPVVVGDVSYKNLAKHI